jgi:isopenicillin-N epimerase
MSVARVQTFCAAARGLATVANGGKGYLGFGSFHSDNVEELIRLPAEQFVELPLPFVPTHSVAAPSCQSSSSKQPNEGNRFHLDKARLAQLEFGSAEARKLFHVDFSQWTFLNHGAFGAALVPAMQHAEQWRTYQEQQPLRFFDRTVLPQLVGSYRCMAKMIGASPTQVALFQNATTAINTIIKSEARDWKTGDDIITMNISYAATKTALREACRHAGVEMRTVRVSIPSTDAAMVDCIVQQLTPRTRFFLLDHITSHTALRLPVAQIAAACAERGVVVAIDGAHSLFNVAVDCDELVRHGASYFVTNTHKWLCSPKGGAAMWVAAGARDRLSPLVHSHGALQGFTSAFIWDGCHDYSTLLSLPFTVALWEAVGVQRARSYIHTLAADAAHMLARAWSTEPLCPAHHSGTSMWLVRTPARTDGSMADEKALQDFLYQHNIECPVKAVQGRLYVRISAHIYNTLADYERLASIVLQFRAGS